MTWPHSPESEKDDQRELVRDTRWDATVPPPREEFVRSPDLYAKTEPASISFSVQDDAPVTQAELDGAKFELVREPSFGPDENGEAAKITEKVRARHNAALARALDEERR